jgi:cytochrome c oxidase cbb3-type subunit 3
MPHDPKVLEHEYDGIQEFDNPTPGWWHFLFYLFLVFGIFYSVLSIAGSPYLKSPQAKLENAKIAATMKKFATMGDLEATPETIASYALSDDWMNYAGSVFAANCASCHEADGGGKVGPNLTDEFGKNVRVIADIHTVIEIGANAGAMPAWGQRFHPNDVILLSSYVASLRGTTPFSAAAAEGEQMEPWPEAEPPVEPDAESAADGG